MSGDVTYQALERLSHMPNNPENPADAIAGQKYNDVDFVGGNISGVTISNLLAPLPINSGGTGNTTANAALNALLPSQTGNGGKALVTNGSNTNWQSIASGINQLTGDVLAGPGSGSQVATLATVNTNVGSFGSASSVPTLTVNGKGLITAASSNTVVAPAGTLTGTTLNSSVNTSSLTAVGTLTIGTWSATTIAVNKGGTGLTTLTTGNVILGAGTSSPTFVAPSTSGNLLTSNGSTWVSSAPGNLTGDVTSVGLATTIKTSVALPGSPTTTTQSVGDNSTKIATTAFVAASGPVKGSILTKDPLVASTRTVQAHGLSGIPNMIVAYLECTTANLGYSIGDRIPINGSSVGANGSNTIFTFAADATNLLFFIGSAMPFLGNKTTGTDGTALTAADWRMIATPYLIP